MIAIDVNFRDVDRALEKFSKQLSKNVDDSIVELGQIAAYQLAYRVQPFGVSGKSKDILDKAIYKDIAKAYKTTGSTYAEIKLKNPNLAAAYLKAVEANDLREAERIVERVLVDYTAVQNTDDGEYLKSLRNQKGRVDTRKPMNLTNDGVVSNLKKKLSMRAGLVKAGFMKAGQALGWRRRIPKWLQQSIPLGSAKIIRNGYKTIVTIINHVRYASDVMPEGQIQIAIQNAYRNQLKKLKREIDALAKKV